MGRLDQLTVGRQSLLQRHVLVVAMRSDQIDAIGVETSQLTFDRGPDAYSREDGAFGGNQDLNPIGPPATYYLMASITIDSSRRKPGGIRASFSKLRRDSTELS